MSLRVFLCIQFEFILFNLTQIWHNYSENSDFMSASEAFFLLGSSTCAYWFIVKLAVACPANSDIVLGFSPASSMYVIVVTNRITKDGMTIAVKKRTSGCFFPLRKHAWSSAIWNFERCYIPPLYNQNDSAFQNRKENLHFRENILFRDPFVRFLIWIRWFRIQTLLWRKLSKTLLRNFHGGL